MRGIIFDGHNKAAPIAIEAISGLTSASDPVVTTRCQLNGTGELTNDDAMLGDIGDKNGIAI
ncbi:MAG: hypothetical protein DYH15_13085 [Nitrosomonas sp. PRO4]|nr:hypothetical protein [Nitrosomonas sp. PRO4]